MIDQASRLKLQNLQTTKAIADGIDRLTSAIKETSVVSAKEQVKTPAGDVADELRSLQKMIGGGNLTASLLGLAQSLDGFNIDENAMGKLRGLVADLTAKIRILSEIEAKIPTEIKMNFPKEFPVTGTVDVGIVESLPPIKVTNLDEVGKSVGMLINNLQHATIKAIQASKVEFPSSISVGNEVKISEFSALLDGIEELKNGFNILINKEAATVGFPSSTIPVEIQNWMVPQPVTNININALQGFVKTTSTTVGTTAVTLPSYGQLFNRRSVMVYNNSANTIYVGGSDVTTANGIPVPASSYSPIFDAGYNMKVYGIAGTGGNDIRVLEVSKDQTGNVQE
jgi:hypothetical protein